ncbi:MAG: type II secretion system F family protein [Phycisphaerae bacterium]|nr:type II secretion system F family protein [Phycisphaerae bacterium]
MHDALFILAQAAGVAQRDRTTDYGTSGIVVLAVFALVVASTWTGRVPLFGWLRRQEHFYTESLYRLANTTITPRVATWFSAALVPILVVFLLSVVSIGAQTQIDEEFKSGTVSDNIIKALAAMIGIVGGLIIPNAFTRYLIRRRVKKLEEQIVSGIQSLASGVRAGLNLVQSFQLLARNASHPLKREIQQLLLEYEHGLTMEQAMIKTGLRIGSPTYRLLFSALETHRIRGGDLGETLDRIADAIREIQRLEKQVDTLTSQGRAAARMMAIMPFVILAILYVIDRPGVADLFVTTMGRFILLGVTVLIGFGFWWIRKIIDIDI